MTAYIILNLMISFSVIVFSLGCITYGLWLIIDSINLTKLFDKLHAVQLLLHVNLEKFNYRIITNLKYIKNAIHVSYLDYHSIEYSSISLLESDHHRSTLNPTQDISTPTVKRCVQMYSVNSVNIIPPRMVIDNSRIDDVNTIIKRKFGFIP